MTNQVIKKNENYTVEIVDLTHEGLGVAKVEGYPLFIENTLPGEEVEILVVKVGKKFGYGKVLHFLKKSEDRAAFKDQAFLRTGIAPLQHMTYEKQLTFKQEQVQKVMTKIAKLPDVPILPIIGMETPLGYRNKAQIPVRKLDNQLETGFFLKNSHDLVPMENYAIQDPIIDQAILQVRDILRRFHVKPYNEEDHTGNLRSIVVRRGYYSHEMMIVLVTRTVKFFQHEKIVKEIISALPEVITIVQNINSEKTNVILGEENIILYGKGYIQDQLLEKHYRISPHSFFQVNSQQAEVLYQTAISFADFSKEDLVIDAYCGIGTIALSLADKVKKVYGVESVTAAIEDAKENANRNQIENVEFLAGKAEEVIPKWNQAGVKADVLIVDPPRKGLSSSFIQSVLESLPKKILYISCNPATFARDCHLLCTDAYRLEKIQPVDLFPMTHHVECVGLLTRTD